MQEELEHKSVVLATNVTKLTGKTLAKLMSAALRKMRQSNGVSKPGRQSLKQLAKGGPLSSIPIKDENIKAFDPIARKYGISYDLKKDESTTPPRWLAFFKAKDENAMTAAFKEFMSLNVKLEKDKPSMRESMRKFRDIVKNAVRDKLKNKHREDPER